MATHLQKKLSKTIKIAVSEVFQKDLALELHPNLVSVGNVVLTPDLQLARIYVSCFPENKTSNIMNIIQLEYPRIKYLVHSKIKNKLRKMPELEFFVDDTFQEQEKVNMLLDKVKAEAERIRNLRIQNGLDPDATLDESQYKNLDDLLP